MVLDPNFIETVDQSEFTLYSDTDSSYAMIPLPFSKFDDRHQTLEYVQNIAHLINRKFLEAFNDTVVKYGNVDPKYNRMNFKTEVIAHRAMFIAKKVNGMAKMWDEGTFFDSPELKKTGGQIVKSDSTRITFDLLNEVYNTLMLDFDITNEVELYQKIFVELSSKYIKRTEESILDFNIYDFGIPKKWGTKTLKSIPKQVQGAMLYNYLFHDVLRPGESMFQTQVIINSSNLLQYMSKNKPSGKFMISEDMVSKKLNVISFPVDITKDDIENIKKVFDELHISFDTRDIIEFNVPKKINQLIKIFKEETKRLAI